MELYSYFHFFKILTQNQPYPGIGPRDFVIQFFEQKLSLIPTIPIDSPQILQDIIKSCLQGMNNYYLFLLTSLLSFFPFFLITINFF
jgi:hypothetical protein